MLIETRHVQCTTLDAVLAQSGYADRLIGYLNIDCEGHDLEVLRGLSLESQQPMIITKEASTEAEHQATIKYLDSFGYLQSEQLHRSLLFVRQ
jgi:hypothetical protein